MASCLPSAMRTLPPRSLWGRAIRLIYFAGFDGVGVVSLAIHLVELGFVVRGAGAGLAESVRVRLVRGGVVLGDAEAKLGEVIYVGEGGGGAGSGWGAPAEATVSPVALLEEVIRCQQGAERCGAGGAAVLAGEWLAAWQGEEKRTEALGWRGASHCAELVGAANWDERRERLQSVVTGGTLVKREEALASKTTMRVGGAARLYAEPATEADLQNLRREAGALGLEVWVLGRGSNLIVPDEGVEGLVLSLAHEVWSAFAVSSGGQIWVGAGLRLKNLCGLATKAGLVGFEFLEGIPGSVGGALRMNAGAMGGWMFDVVTSVKMLSREGEIQVMARGAMQVDYRHCRELEGAIALGAWLRASSQAEVAAISRQIDVYRKKRHEAQPREPSAGCIFKNPAGDSAGRLIDECGLKGERVGDAEVSKVHANFLVNQGRASGADMIALVRRVRARVRQLKGVVLEPEVLLYGKRWEDVL